MEAENEDPFASIIKLCQIFASPVAKVPNCPLARESEMFLDSNDEQFSSSPDLSPSQPTGIVVVSLPDSVDQHTDEDDAEFVTPPEYHNSHLSSSEDQNPNELQLRVATKVRVSEGGLDDEPEMKRVKIDEECDGDIVRLGETEEAENKADEAEIIVLGSGDSGAENKGDDAQIKGDEAEIIVLASGDFGAEKNKGDEAEIIVLANGDSGAEKNKGDEAEIEGDEAEIIVLANGDLGAEKDKGDEAEIEGDEADIIVLYSDAEEIMTTSDLDAAGEAGTVSTVGEIGGLLSNCDAVNENHELELGENVEVISVARAEMPNERNGDDNVVPSAEMSNENRDSIGNLDSGVTDIAKLEDIAAKSSLKVKLRICGPDKAVKTSKDAKKPKDRHRSRRVRSGRKRIEEIDEFRYDGECEGRTGRHASGSGSKRLLPPSFKGKEKEAVESLKKKSGSLGLVDMLPPPSYKGKEKEVVESPEKESGFLGLPDRLPPPSFKGKQMEVVESLVKKSGSLGLVDKLPPLSRRVKEKEAVESPEKESGSFDLVDILNTVFGGMNGGCDDDEDVDFLATAKRKGMTFPRPRWWPDDNEEGFPY